jgi:GT2 family glycosyltransferase
MMRQVQIEVWHASDATAETANRHLAETDATHIVWLEQYGELVAGALEVIEATLSRFDADLMYGDTYETSTESAPVVRPTFSPLRLREQDYFGPVIVMDVGWMRSVGGFDPGAANIHGYDFALRFDGAPERVIHIPQVLSMERGKSEEGELQLAAVRRRFVCQPISAVVAARADGSRRVSYESTGEPLVSIVIPTRGSTAEVKGRDIALVVEAVRGIVERTDYSNIEVIVVADDPTPQQVIDELIAVAGEHLRLVRYSEPFNFSAKINRGAVYARGEFLLLLNDDIDVIEPDWLSTMMGLVQQPGVGIVGSLLLFEDGSVQHGGHLYRESWAAHVESPQEKGNVDRLGGFGVTREVSGVTAACSLVRAEDFWRVGGLSTEFPGNYNDVDFCLKIRSTGGTAVWSPDAKLFHFESKSRDATILPDEIMRLRQRWGTRLLIDQYWAD